MSTTVISLSTHIHAQDQRQQRRVRSWILERLHEADLSKDSLAAKLEHSACPFCRTTLSYQLHWLMDENYLELDPLTEQYILGPRGVQRLISKERNPNFAKPGYVRLIGHIHATL